MTLPATVFVEGARALTGEVRAPGDKSTSHRGLLLGAMAEGTSTLRELSRGDDVRRTLAAVAALGAEVHELDGVGGSSVVTVTGGRQRLRPPARPIDCGNSGTAMRLLAGLVAGLDGTTLLTGDESLRARPMDRVAVPLIEMGALVRGEGERCHPPITVTGGRLRGIHWTPAMASAQVKSAVLLAGLWADGETVVTEKVATRAHTEEVLALAGADLTVEETGDGGRVVHLRPAPLQPFELTVPGDPSQAAFWLAAACLVPGSAVRARGVYVGRERTGFVEVLRRMGAAVEIASRHGTTGDLVARFGGRDGAGLHGTVVDAAEIPSLDEVPVLAVVAAAAAGTTEFRQMGELRVKETDRMEALVRLVEGIGGRAEVSGDDLVVRGGGRLRHTRSTSHGDHRMAMAAVVAALAAGPGESRIDDFACVETSYPSFLGDLGTLGGRARLPLLAIDGPAGSGKSTVSQALADRLAVDRLDTGAMYRAVAWAALDRGVDPADAPAVASIAQHAVIEVGAAAVAIDGAVVTGAIRTPEVNRSVSTVAANPQVRRALVERQRAWAEAHGGGVVEGRDIGSVVFPHADLKVFLTASPEERARRRHEEPHLARRDELDTTREASPLQLAGDAHLLDTTGRSVEDVVAEIVAWL